MRSLTGRLSRLRPSPAIVVSALALFLAIGGIGYAGSKIDTNDLVNGAVTKKKLHKAAVTKKKVHKNAITSKKVKNHSLKCKDMKFDCPVAGVAGVAGGGEGAAGEPGAPGAGGAAGPGQAFGF